jgi:hypothetical protein
MLREHVRHVILSHHCPQDVALKLLSLGNSTVNLVITAGRGREILPLLASPPLKHTWQSLSHITDSRFVQLKIPDHWAERECGARGFDDY